MWPPLVTLPNVPKSEDPERRSSGRRSQTACQCPAIGGAARWGAGVLGSLHAYGIYRLVYRDTTREEFDRLVDATRP